MASSRAASSRVNELGERFPVQQDYFAVRKPMFLSLPVQQRQELWVSRSGRNGDIISRDWRVRI